MKANRKLIREANKVLNKYNGWNEPKAIVNMYDELEAIGITLDIFTHRIDHLGGYECKEKWYYNGEEIENSIFVFQVYEGGNSIRNEYNMYFS